MNIKAPPFTLKNLTCDIDSEELHYFKKFITHKTLNISLHITIMK